MSEKLVKTAFLSIGSNLGNRKKNINIAKFKLEKNKINVIKSSNNYETLSWPNKKNPKFINVVLKVKTTLTAYELMKKCLQIENELGRKRTIGKKYLPRTCDIDIIDYNGQTITFDYKDLALVIPHKNLESRNFVLFPLKEIYPNWKHPKTKEIIDSIIEKLPEEDRKSILKIKKS